jgi:hypothetical protein
MIRPKKRVKKVLWRTGQVKEDAAGMRALRLEVYRRAGGRCEVEWNGKRCGKFAKWDGFGHGELAHLDARGRGGSDTAANCLWACGGSNGCHKRKFHPGPEWSPLIRRRTYASVPDQEGREGGLHADVR